jgi:hypothetical protein
VSQRVEQLGSNVLRGCADRRIEVLGCARAQTHQKLDGNATLDDEQRLIVLVTRVCGER